LFTCSTIAALADHILTELGLGPGAAGAGAASGAASAGPGGAAGTGDGADRAPSLEATFDELDIEAISDEEAEQLLLLSIELINREKTDE
jgi:hypothetical protein